MSLLQQIKEATAIDLTEAYAIAVKAEDIAVNQTKPEFE